MNISHRFPQFIKLLKEENVDIDLLIERVEECIDYSLSGYPMLTGSVDPDRNMEYKRLVFFHQLLISIRTHFYGTIVEQNFYEHEEREKLKQQNFEAFLVAFNVRFKGHIH